ncbi:MAG: AAA family ATPase [Gemmataceae bacterium]|nr:AAA family ATPase [Gemmataceae bacterium]
MPAPWLAVDLLDTATDADLAAAIGAFLAAACPLGLHAGTTTRIRPIRHALNHLVRGQDVLPDRLARCVTPGEVYAVPGLGRTFWAAVVKALDPDRHPFWCPASEQGLIRLGLLDPAPAAVGPRFAALLRGYEVIRAASGLTANRIDDFLGRVAGMTTRDLPETADPAGRHWGPTTDRVREAVREVRVRVPLRGRLRGASAETMAALSWFQAAAERGDWVAAGESLRAAFPDGRWEAVLPQFDDADDAALSFPERAKLWCEVAAVLRDRFRVHPLELADVVAAAVEPDDPTAADRPGFGGFAGDTFRFLGELADADGKDWLAARRERYQFVLREPLVELCEALAERYVRPVLGGEYGWELEADARPGRALTSICKNDFGRSGPYQPVQWVTFFRRAMSTRRADAQFFVRVAPDGVKWGFHLGRSAREAGKQFRRNVQEHAEALFAALAAGRAFDLCRFWAGDDLGEVVRVRTPADLREWAANKTVAVGRGLPPGAEVLRHDELVGEILLTFDRLVPAFACAAEADPLPLLRRRAGSPDSPPAFDRAAFNSETFLSDVWLDRVYGLLALKKQLILQGVPGTGKTHVARCLARLLTADRPDAVRLVQFHPAYSYEEFVEGIRARNVEIDGRAAVTYPVEDGVLCAFAEQAARRPSEPHVLLIDEINRGNLPRVFGELLYLLEYRDQAVTLPYSKRAFRLPDNLIVVATMNAADRSAVALDQALRRRFSFVEMPPDAALLAHWLERHPPADPDEAFGPRVVRAFEELNRRLSRDLGPDRQVGHSFFMVPGLDSGKLGAVWDHHVRPLLLDAVGGRVDRLAEYDLGRLLDGRKGKARQRV